MRCLFSTRLVLANKKNQKCLKISYIQISVEEAEILNFFWISSHSISIFRSSFYSFSILKLIVKISYNKHKFNSSWTPPPKIKPTHISDCELLLYGRLTSWILLGSHICDYIVSRIWLWAPVLVFLLFGEILIQINHRNFIQFPLISRFLEYLDVIP